VSIKDVDDFSGHCGYIHSVYVFTMRIWRDSDEAECKIAEAMAPSIFADLSQLLGEYLIIAACRVTDPASGGKNENFTVEMFVNALRSDPETFKRLDELHQRMKKLRKIILPARHKLAAHADRDTIRGGKPLGAASWAEWDDFWLALQDFVRLLNERTKGKPFEIDAGGVFGDAEMLLRGLRQSQYFEALAKSDNPVIRDACLKLALPNP